MTFPYLVLSASAAGLESALSAAAAALRAAGWIRRDDDQGNNGDHSDLQVWTTGQAPVARLPDGRGWRLGWSFPRGGSAAPADPSAGTPLACAERLCRDTWGGYVAVLRGATGAAHALRDPSGALEAYTWRAGPLAVLASGLEVTPAALRPDRLALDWAVVAAMLASPFGTASLSGLGGVSAVTAGTLQPLGAPAADAQAAWRIARLAGRPRQTDPAWAGRLLSAVRTAVTAEAASHARLLAEVSGGLDSAMVLACLAAGGFAGRVVGALHYVGDREESDERDWAGRVAGHWGVPLTCVTRVVGDLDPERDFAGLCEGARPPFAALDAWRDADVAARLAASGASAVFTGMGGDASLFQIPTARVLADLFADRGPRALADPLGLGMARWLRRSVWSVWAEALRSLRRETAAAALAFAAPAVRAAHAGPTHPWILAARDLPPARRLQVASLAGLQLIRGPDRRSTLAARVHPLLSQPVMEAALEIPVWGLVAGGRGRGLARDAFAPLLPPEIAGRTSKGGLTSLYSRRLAAGAERLRPYLLDGALAAAGLLDRTRVDAALSPEALIRRNDGLALVRVAALEAWVRSWGG